MKLPIQFYNSEQIFMVMQTDFPILFCKFFVYPDG